MKKKKNIIGIILLLSVGVTIAFFSSTATLENEFKSGKYKTVTEEEFVSPNNWKPGDTIPKTIVTTNEGTLPVRVRIKLEESWTSENGDDLPLSFDGFLLAANINFDSNLNLEKWVEYDGYYYYTDELEPDDSTTSLITGVTFNSNVNSDVNCTNDGGIYTCESTGDGYDGATYNLKIITETVQSDAYMDAWNLDIDPTVIIKKYSISNSWTDDNIVLEDDYEDINKPVFMKLSYVGNTSDEENRIFEEVGFIYNNNVYYLKGGGATYFDRFFTDDSPYFEENMDLVISLFGADSCQEMIEAFGVRAYYCSKDNIDIHVGMDGEINVYHGINNTNWNCSTSSSHNFSCSTGMS